MNLLEKKLELKKNGKFMIAVDLDGTIIDENLDEYLKHKGNWWGKIKEGALDFLNWAREQGHFILIYTVRTNPESLFAVKYKMTEQELKKVVEKQLNALGVPYDEVYIGSGKPFADITIDDRAIKFTSWEEVSGVVKHELRARKGDIL